MRFSIIYTFDVPSGVSVKCFKPRFKCMQQTEDDDQYELSHLEGEWTRGKHRKYCGILTRAQFDKFISDTGLCAKDVETMGSIGAPGFGIGIAPAIAFHVWSDEPKGILDAYVTPMPDVDPEWFNMDPERGERAWKRIKRAILKMYG